MSYPLSAPGGALLRRIALPTLAALATAFPLAAQNGSLTGSVTSRTSAPLSEVQVFIVGTQLGGLTTGNGRYLIRNLAPGTYEVRAVRIGFEQVTQEVTVTADQVTQLDFVLNEQALGLDEIVVTGTAGAARRREVGNSITQIDVADVAAPAPSLDQLLQAKSPGLTVSAGNGSSGSGAQIRLRGAVSVSQSNQPIIYVDGVRVRSEPYARNISPTEGAGRGGNVTASPLNDINPADIERIEVLKGSAASTLYGTEAAAGVIQIFTKRGASGAPRWTMQVDQGFNKLLPFAPDVDVRPVDDPLVEGPRGSYSYQYLNMDPFLKTAHRQKYSLSVAGGAETLQYFISGQMDFNEGVLPLDEENKRGVRGNFTFTPINSLVVQVNSAYNRTEIQNTPAGNNAQGLTLNAFRRERNYIGDPDPVAIRGVYEPQDVTTRIDRFVIGSTLSYAPGGNFDTRMTVGYDQAVQDNRQLRPYGFVLLPGGKLYTDSRNYGTLTADLVANYRLSLGGDNSVQLSAGGQSVTSDSRIVQAEGTDFAGPGDPDVDAGANRLSWESRIREVNAGFFGQALFNFKDRYFITAGFRVDGNSAFGSSLGLQTYPKVSVAYVISDESFWDEDFGSLKLRAAYGQSGRAPGTFDAVRTWNAIGYGGEPTYLPDNLGNPDLGPERTGETEFGFDWAGFDNRLMADFTWYRQHTTDALFSVRHAPSEGFATSQQENIGELENKGIELNLNAAVVDGENWGLDLGTSIYTNSSEVLSLGGAPPFSGGGSWIEEGYPVTLIRGVTVTNPDALAPGWDAANTAVLCSSSGVSAGDPCINLDVPIGPQAPTKIYGFNTALRMPLGIELSARGEYQGGHYIYDGPSNEGVNRNIRWPTCSEYYGFTDAGNGAQAPAELRYRCDSRFYRRGSMIYKADFFKIRDVTARLPLGTLIPGSANSTLTLSAQNFYRWRNEDFPIFDPEMVSNSGFGNQVPSITEHIPPAASFVASIRVVF
ncbi:TonB-dependent receptor [Gaopeijia maritima]|uniref:TonB-dependent receptor domain-containing protein n=1 Tax=Gaopeijia maritima TaxID=3119007 RepID=UPI00324A5580